MSKLVFRFISNILCRRFVIDKIQKISDVTIYLPSTIFIRFIHNLFFASFPNSVLRPKKLYLFFYISFLRL